MSILDGMPTQDEFMKAAESIAPAFNEWLASDKVSEKYRSFIQLMSEGLSPGDILGIKKEHRDALLNVAFGMMSAGENAKAKDLLGNLHILEPIDTRACYGLGLIAQQEADFPTAGKLFVHFLAMDATNPDGHLRLGECLLAAGELPEAIECFELAKALALKGYAPADRVAYAEKMLGFANDRLSKSK